MAPNFSAVTFVEDLFEDWTLCSEVRKVWTIGDKLTCGVVCAQQVSNQHASEFYFLVCVILG